MRRYLHNGLVALLCVCLLVSYTPLPASANPTQGGGAEATAAQDVAGGTGGAGAAAAEGPSVGEPGAVDANGQATTTVNVITTGFSLLGQTEDFADTIDTIKTKPIDLNVVTAGGKGPYTCEWTRTVDGVKDAGFSDAGTQVAAEGKTTFTYALSKHTDTLKPQTSYVYSLKVTDTGNTAGAQNTVSASIAFGTTGVKYGPATLKDNTTPGTSDKLSATFTLVHPQAALAVAPLAKGSPTYDMLQGAAAGKPLVSGAVYQADLTGVPTGDLPFLDKQVSVAISGLETVTYAGKTVTVVGLVNGKTTTQEVVVSAEGTATFNTPALGAFALAYADPGAKTYTVTSSVTGEGGTVSPLGAKPYPDGATPTYTVLPNAGYEVAGVTLDGTAVTLTGNSYTFPALAADHAFAVAFTKVTPDPAKTFTVDAKVTGGNGQVKVSGGALGVTSLNPKVEKGSKSTVQFVPNEGFVIDAVTVKVGAGAATPVVVFSNTYAIAAVTADTTVEVTYKKGVTPPVITHAITPSPCTNGSISPASVQTVPHAGTASFVVQADDMYVIDAITVDGTPVATQATGKAAFTYELENVLGDHTIAATFKADARATVTITANSGTNGKISPAGDRVLYKGDPATYYLYPDTGYELGAVSLATTGATGPATDITSQVKGGVLALTAAQTAASATLDASFKKSALPDLPEGDKDTYYALTAVAYENGSISPAGTTRVKAGASQIFYFTPNEGFTVDTVKANGKVVDFAGLSYTLPDVRCNTTLEVFYRALGGEEVPPVVPVMHTLTAQAGKGGSVSPAPTVAVPEGGSMPITIAPESDYAVATISVDGTPVYTAPGKSAAAASVLDAIGAALFGAEPLAQTPPAAYLFENVKADHTLAVTFAYKGTAPEPSYHQIDARVEGGNGTITPQGVSKVADKGAQTFSFVPASGYVVDQVRVNGILAPGPVTGNFYTVSNIMADTSVVVSFKPQSGAVDPITYTISATTSAGGAISPAGDSAVVAGASLGYMFTPSTGYELSGVLVDGTANADALAKGSYTFTNVTEPHSIKALFKATGTTPVDPTDPDKKFVTLSTKANEGGSITPANPQVAVGSTAEFRVLPDRGFELKSLLLDGAEVKDQLVGGKLTLENVLAAHTLTATFSALPTPPADEFRSVTATAGANGKISPAGVVQVKLGATQTFTFAPDAGFVVDKVTVDGTSVPNTANVSDYTLVNIQKNSKIDVSFRAKKTTDPDPAATHTIKATATGGGSISPAGDVLVADKGTAQFAFNPDDGYELTALSVGGTPVLDPVPSGYTFNNVVADSSIAATFAKKAPVTQKFNLSTEVVGGNGRVAPAGTTSVVAHTAQTVYCYPDAGFAVSSVMVTAGTGAPVEMLGSLVGGTALTIDDFTMDTKVAVSFDKGTTPDVSTYKVKASATKGGTISPEGETTVTKGGSLAFALTAQAGYQLQHIVLTRGTSTPLTVPVSGASYTLGNVTSDCSVQAVYAAVPEPPTSYYTVNASVAAAADGSKGGSISPEGSVRVASGNVQTFYFTPNSGQVVDKVLVDGVPVPGGAGVLSYTLPAVTKDTTLTVSFVAGTTPPLPTQYPLTATATAGGTISPRGETQVHQGGQLLYTFAAEEGYTLTKVEVDGGSAKGGSDLSAEQLAQGFYRFVGVNAAHTIHATFAADAPVAPETRYSVSASVDATGGGSVSPAQTDNIAADTPVVFTFVPAADKVVSSLTLTKNGQKPVTFDYSANSYTLTGIDANTQLVVAFADKPGTKPPATHKVSVSVSGTGGTITPSGENQVLHNGALLLSVAPDATPGAEKQLDTLKVTRNGVTTDVAAQVKSGAYVLTGITVDTKVEGTFTAAAVVPPTGYYTLNASATGGSISPAGDSRVAKGQAQTFTLVPDAGNKLKTLTLSDPDGANPSVVASSEIKNGTYTFTPTADKKVVAEFTADGTIVGPDETFPITTSATSGGSVSPSKATAAKGSSLTLTFTPDKGYHVDAVMDGTTPVDPAKYANNAYVLANITAAHDVHVVFVKNPVVDPEPETYTVTSSVTAGTGSIAPEGKTLVKAGASPTFSLVPGAGQAIDTLTLNGETVTPEGFTYTILNIAADATLSVSFRAATPTDPELPKFATIAASAGPGGVISPAGDVKAVVGSAPSFTFVADAGYHLKSVVTNTGDVTSQVRNGSYTFPTITDATAGRSIRAEFEPDAAPPLVPDTYTITASVADAGSGDGQPHGTITPAGTTKVAAGGSQNFSFIPEKGYKAETLSINGAKPIPFTGTGYTLFGVNANQSIEVKFVADPAAPEVPKYTVNASATLGGTINPSGLAEVAQGQGIGYIFTANSGYELYQVEVDGVGLVDGTTTTVPPTSYFFPATTAAGDHSIKALFKPKGGEPVDPDKTYYDIVATANAGGTLTPEGTTRVLAGASASYRAFPSKGFELTDLTLDGTSVFADVVGGKYTIANVGAGHKLDATFSALPTPPADVFHSVTASVANSGDGQPHGAVSPAGSLQLKEGSNQTFTFVPEVGYVVAQVAVDGKAVANTANVSDYTLTNIAKTTTLEVTFKAKETTDPDPAATHTIKAAASSGGRIQPAGDIKVTDKGSMQFTFIPNAGYEFGSLTVDGNLIDSTALSYDFNNVVADHSLTVNFKPVVPPVEPAYYNLTTEIAPGGAGTGTITPSPGISRVATHTDQTVHFIPDAGSVVESVMVTEGDGAPVNRTADLAKSTLTLEDFTKDTLVSVTFGLAPGPVPPDPPTKHIVTASATKGGKISPAGSSPVVAGESLGFTLTAQTGFKLKHVTLTRGADAPVDVSVSGTAYTLDKITSDCTVVAVFESATEPPPATFVVNASAGLGGSISPIGAVTVDAGASITFYFTPDDGQVVDQVKVGTQEPFAVSGSSYTIPAVTQDTSIAVSFKPNPGPTPPPGPTMHAITATATAGGSIAPVGVSSVPEGGQMDYKFAAENGYSLTRVEVDGAANAAALAQASYQFVAVTGPHTIHAIFTADKPIDPAQRYTVKAQVEGGASGGGTVSPDTVENVPAGSTAVFSFKPEANKKVAQLTIAKKGKDPITFAYASNSYTLTGIDANTTLTVKFADGGEPVQPTTHKVTAAVGAGGGGTIAPGTADVLDGKALLLALKADAGKQLDKLMVQRGADPATDEAAQVKNDTYYLDNVKGECTVTATFKNADKPPAGYYTLHVSATGGGSISPKGDVRVTKGQPQTFTMAPASGQKLQSLKLDGVDVIGQVTNGVYTFTPDAANADKTLVAEFVPDGGTPPPPITTHTVSTTVTSGGNVTPATAQPADGSDLTLTFTPNKGYRVAAVSVDGIPLDSKDFAGGFYTLKNITKDIVVHVAFAQIPVEPEQTYRVTSSVTAGKGEISPKGTQEVAAGEARPFTFVPETGWVLDTVLVNDRQVTPDGLSYTLLNVSADTTVKASFKEDKTAPESDKPSTITTSVSGAGGSIEPAGPVYAALGVAPSFKFTPDAGHHLASVLADGTNVTEQAKAKNTYAFAAMTVPESTHTLRATFEPDPAPPVEPDSYTITATAGEHGKISPAGTTTVKAGGNQTFALLPEKDYKVKTVRVDRGTTVGTPFTPAGNTYQLFNVNADMSIHVDFVYEKGAPGPETYKVTPTAGVGGSISPNTVTEVVAGTPSGDFSFAPATGYELYRVLVDGTDLVTPPAVPPSKYSFPANTDATKDHSIEAQFKVAGTNPDETFDIIPSVDAGGGGTIDPSVPVAVRKGASQTFIFAPDKGIPPAANKAVASITVDGVQTPYTANSYTFTDVQAPHTISVQFVDAPVEVYWTVSVAAGLHGTVAPAGDNSVLEGDSLPLIITPDEGWETDQVLVDGVVVQEGGTAYTLANVMTDHQVRVTFKSKTPIEPDPDKPPVDVEVKVKVAVGEVAGGSVSPSSVTAVYGTSPKFYIYPDEGYVLEWAKVGDKLLETHLITAAGTLRARAAAVGGGYWFTLDKVTENLVVDVKFRKLNPGETPLDPVDRNTVTAHEAEGGIISPKGATFVPNNGEVAYTLQANKGYHLQSLMVGGQEKIGEVQKGSTAGSLNAKGQIIRGMYKLTGVTGNVDVVPVFATDEEPVPPPALFTFTSSVTGGYGKISPEGNVTVEQGKSQVFYFYPDAGYAVASIVIDGAKLPYTATSYEFSNVQGAHTVEVAFGPIAPPGPNGPIDKVVHALNTAAASAAAGDNPGVFLLLALALASAAVCVAAATRRRPARTRHAS